MPTTTHVEPLFGKDADGSAQPPFEVLAFLLNGLKLGRLGERAHGIKVEALLGGRRGATLGLSVGADGASDGSSGGHDTGMRSLMYGMGSARR